jgi:hypothetical protein
MHWTPPCTRHWTKTGKKQTNTTQYALDTTMHKTLDEDRKKRNKHNTICIGHHHAQDTGRRQKKTKNTTQYVLDTTMHKTLDEDRKKQKNTTQYVLDTIMHKTLDEDRKKTKKHNTICIGHHHAQNTSKKTKTQ